VCKISSSTETDSMWHLLVMSPNYVVKYSEEIFTHVWSAEEDFFYLVCEAISTAATSGLLCQPRVIVKMIVEKQMECRLAGETDVLGENLPQRYFFPSQNPTWIDPRLNPGSRRLTAWAKARPEGVFIYVLWRHKMVAWCCNNYSWHFYVYEPVSNGTNHYRHF
jgi:hypothetical protein